MLVLSQGAAHAASDPVLMSFATVGDSRVDPATAETAQDKVNLQNTRALSRILREIQALFFNGDMNIFTRCTASTSITVKRDG